MAIDSSDKLREDLDRKREEAVERMEEAQEEREEAMREAEAARKSAAAGLATGAVTENPLSLVGAAGSAEAAKAAAKAASDAKKKEAHERKIAEEHRQAQEPVGIFTAALFLLVILVLFAGIVLFNLFVILGALIVLLLWFMGSERAKLEFNSLPGILFFVALVVHAFMFKSGFAFSTTFTALIALVYAIILFVYWSFSKNSGEHIQGAIMAFVLTILVYALPPLQFMLGGTEFVNNLAIFIASIFPAWPLYMLIKIRGDWDDGYANGILFLYKILLVILVVGFFMYGGLKATAVLPQVNLGGVDASEGVMGFLSDFWEKVTKSWNRVPILINQSLNPGAYYTGQVEENTKTPLGVRIESLRPIDDVVDNRTEIIVYGNVYAKSFIEEEDSIDVQGSCVIDRKDAPSPVVDPPVMDIVLGTSGSFQCTFPPMKKGTYSVKGYATFPFQTWAYISYTFVDDERARNLARQGLDIRQEMDIQSEPMAIYTSGPVTLGMGGTPQPIRVSADAEHPLPDGTRIGITLDPGWESGRLDYVRRLELKVPEPFYLYGCDREVTNQETDAFEPLYTSYVFENTALDVVTSYTSVTCQLGITDPARAQLMVSEADKVVRSFIGVAHYTYTVQSQTSVRVR